jgi:hypothetical protein
MVYNIQDDCFFNQSIVRYSKEHRRFGNSVCFRHQLRVRHLLSLVNHWALVLSNGPNGVGVFHPPPPRNFTISTLFSSRLS